MQPSTMQTEQETTVLEEELEWLTYSRSGVLGLLLGPQPRQITLRNDLPLPFLFLEFLLLEIKHKEVDLH